MSSLTVGVTLTGVETVETVGVVVTVGGLGLLDDVLKIKRKNSTGLKSKYKFTGQIIIGSFALFILIIGMIGWIIDVMIFGYSSDVTGPMGWIITIATALPSLAVGARRLHDTDKTGWWQLLWITIIGGILVLIWQATMGENKKNKYGSPVKK